MEIKSPPPCPATVTVRRNPHRKARPTPSSAVPFREPLSSPSLSRNIFATDTVQNPNNADHCKIDSSTKNPPENLKVFLRIRPLTVQNNSRTIQESKNTWPKNPKIKSNPRPKTKKSSETCVEVSEDMHSVTVSTPKPLQEMKRIKSEVYEGFSHVFSAESSQNDVYEEMVKPLVEDFLKGKSGMLAAMGPSGSGKSHTVFGSAREPGMVPLALRHIFSEVESKAARSSRLVYLSVFEISSERGKSEKMIDLLHDGGEVSMQHSVIKGLQEAAIYDAQQAESLIARGMLKRATAMTNSNSQSSRSQCIITIRSASVHSYGEVDGNTSNDTILTIVDLAGAEREKKTGNQGARLLESNFINNTSMVFGQCLRSLLEHQRNRNKMMQKHYKNSLLTRYLRDYLEGKKRMMLILTVKPGVEDYLDTSFLLRQASPFAKIKFKIVEEPAVLTNKRPSQALSEVGQLKKMKFGNNEPSLIDEEQIDRGSPQIFHKDASGDAIEGCHNPKPEDIYDENINEVRAISSGFVGLRIPEKFSLKGNDSMLKVQKDREYKIMQGFSKALWNVLKQYKEKLEGLEIENCHLRDSLASGKTRIMDLENELTNAKLRISHLEKLAEAPKQLEDLSDSTDDMEKRKGDTNQMDECFRTNVLSTTSINSSQEFVSCEDTGTSETTIQLTSRYLHNSHKSWHDAVNNERDVNNLVPEFEDITSPSEVTSLFLPASNESEQDAVNVVEHVKNLESASKDDIPFISEPSTLPTSRILYASCRSEQDDVNILGDVKNLELESESAMDGSCLVTSLEYRSEKNTQDYEDIKDPKQEQAQFQNECECAKDGSCLVTSLECKSVKNTQDFEDIKDAEQELIQFHESEYALNGSCLVTSIECESNKNIKDSEGLEDAKQEMTQFHNEQDNVAQMSPSIEEHTVPTAATCFLDDLKSSESPWDGDTCNHEKEESTCIIYDGHRAGVPNMILGACGKLEPSSTILPKEGLNAQFMPKVVPKVAVDSNQHTEKPRRRLQPASSVLLKDLSLLNIKDETDKPKGGKAGKRGTADEKNRTQGSIHLLNLLSSKVVR